MVLVNSREEPSELGLATGEEILTVDATGIALKHLGVPIMNTALMGAFAGVTELIERGSINKVIRRRFSAEVAEKNVAAVNEAYEMVK